MNRLQVENVYCWSTNVCTRKENALIAVSISECAALELLLRKETGLTGDSRYFLGVFVVIFPYISESDKRVFLVLQPSFSLSLSLAKRIFPDISLMKAIHFYTNLYSNKDTIFYYDLYFV